jgi:nucleotide-binding universal stress UspA family protein
MNGGSKMIYHHILVAYDGSKASEKAFQHAIKLIDSKSGTKLTLAHVVKRIPTTVAGYGFVPPDGYMEEVQRYEAALLDQAKAQIAALPYADVVVLTGDPASAILEYVKGINCDLIVMGSRGLGTIREWMLGSVSHNVVQNARIPVLIVK